MTYTANQNDQLLTKRELAQYFKISTRQIDRYRAAGFNMGEVKISPRVIRFKLSIAKRKFKVPD